MPKDKTGHFYYEWYPAIYRGDTQHLTLKQDGAYRRLIDHYIETKAPILDNDLAISRIVGVGVEEWIEIRDDVVKFFKPSENPLGYLIHTFCENTLEKHSSRITKSSKNGKKGGRPKKPKDKDNNPVGKKAETQQKAEQNRTEHISNGGVSAGAHVNINDSSFRKVFDAGTKIHPRLEPTNTSSIKKWIAAGCDAELDIIPVIEKSEGKDIGSWSYFDRPVMQAKVDREKPLPEPEASAKVSGVETESERENRFARIHQKMLEDAKRENGEAS